MTWLSRLDPDPAYIHPETMMIIKGWVLVMTLYFAVLIGFGNG